jgi:hypothetical protein
MELWMMHMAIHRHAHRVSNRPEQVSFFLHANPAKLNALPGFQAVIQFTGMVLNMADIIKL